ncbi:hypothetical protein [Clostridium thermarum]|uniref:hypothetical protein n=1 Tax=Clostridium thermarum TaxID=1716543 RepID=UPI0013D15C2E|nr:hypothetical protein [Clostridium thermarum]
MAFKFLGGITNGINGTGGMPQVPFFVGLDYEDDYSSKLSHDTYNVYVNDDYVGKKVLVAQGEKVEDINGFLNTQGFRNYKTSLKGNSYNISCSPDESRHMKDTLNVYLKIR